MYGFGTNYWNIQSLDEIFSETNGSNNDGMNICLASSSIGDIQMPSTSYSAENSRVEFSQRNLSLDEFVNRPYAQHAASSSTLFASLGNSIDEFDIDQIHNFSIDEFVNRAYAQNAASSPTLYAEANNYKEEFNIDQILNSSPDNFVGTANRQNVASSSTSYAAANECKVEFDVDQIPEFSLDESVDRANAQNEAYSLTSYAAVNNCKVEFYIDQMPNCTLGKDKANAQNEAYSSTSYAAANNCKVEFDIDQIPEISLDESFDNANAQNEAYSLTSYAAENNCKVEFDIDQIPEFSLDESVDRANAQNEAYSLTSYAAVNNCKVEFDIDRIPNCTLGKDNANAKNEAHSSTSYATANDCKVEIDIDQISEISLDDSFDNANAQNEASSSTLHATANNCKAKFDIDQIPEISLDELTDRANAQNEAHSSTSYVTVNDCKVEIDIDQISEISLDDSFDNANAQNEASSSTLHATANNCKAKFDIDQIPEISLDELTDRVNAQNEAHSSTSYAAANNCKVEFDIDQIPEISLDESVDRANAQNEASSSTSYAAAAKNYKIEFGIDQIPRFSLDELFDRANAQNEASYSTFYAADNCKDEFNINQAPNFSLDDFIRHTQHVVSKIQREHIINENSETSQHRQQIADLPPPKYIRIIRETSKFFKKFNTTLKITVFKANDSVVENNLEEWLESVINELLARSLNGCDPDDYVGIRIDNSNVPERPIGISLRKVLECNPQMVMDAMASILQSNESFFTDDILTMCVTLIALPRGGGGRRVNLVGRPADDFCAIKRNSFIFVASDDNMCLARSLILAIAHKTQSPRELKSLLSNYTLLTNKSLELCGNVGIGSDTVCNYEHIKLFQNYLQKYTIRVYNSRDGSTTVFEGPISDDRVVLNLYLENNHYSVIKTLTGAFSAAFFCEYCKKRYHHRTGHRTCPYKCPCCFSRPQCEPSSDKIRCDYCKRDFRGIHCFNNHKKNLCSQLRRCLICFKSIWKGKKDHKCGSEFCTTCLTVKPVRHLCFMGPIQRSENRKIKFVYIFYDLECTQDTQDDEGHFEHKPNFCVAQNVCYLCLDNDDVLQDCSNCGRRQHIFKDNPVTEFLKYVSTIKKDHRIFVIAHNMKGYDGSFVLKEIMENVKAWSPKIINNGTKLMSISCGNIKFLDSLNFIPLPLSQLPETFGFDGMKGYFPHLFNTSCNEYYVGPLPNFEFYAPDNMSISERKRFFGWYNACLRNNFIFSMKYEIAKYCISDVNILRKACLKFRQTFLSYANVDPFLEAVTIAGACNFVFRKTFLKENTIAIIPTKGYRMCDNQSISALKWLLHMQIVLNERIQYSGVGREFRLPEGILVDGYIDSTKTVLEYNGCYYHGCRKCYSYHTVGIDIPKNNKTLNQTQHMFQRYEATIAKHQKIQSLGYNLISVWECEFNETLKKNPELKNLLDQQCAQYKNPLNPRDAFFGGRTNAVKLHHSVNTNENEEIHYYDVCSLYPYVNKYKKYPVGHPKIHIGDDCMNIDLKTVEGIVKCLVLPPQNLYHPVLPYRCNRKLMFPLCRTCAENLEQNECDHTNEQRSFIGTYVADELRKAIEMNYTVLKIFEIWEYEVTQYNPEKKEGGLFAEYINKFLKLKQESSGWPSNCDNEEKKIKFLWEYFEKEGIMLDFDKVSNNSGFRYLAKLMLNSFWGKFGQRENMSRTSIIFNPEELYNTITDPSKNTQSILFVNDECIVVNWKSVEEAVLPLRTVNVVIAAYTTAFARLVLYEYLEKLGDRVIYFDTDSVFVTKKQGEWVPETGDFLGMMKNELETYGKNAYITDFISTGPKSYSFKVFSPETNIIQTVCKVKGITLNYKNSQTINFDSMKELVLGNYSKIDTFNDRKIVRRSDYQVVSKPESKTHRLQFNKRRRLPDSFDSVPYGFKLNV